MLGTLFKSLVLISSLTTPSAEAPMVTANNQFAFEMYQQIQKQKPGENLFFSPHSIHTALSMTTEGANGKTLEEMQQVLHLLTDRDANRKAYSALLTSLSPKEEAYELATANAIWPNLRTPMKASFPEVISTYYQGVVTPLDYQGAPDPSRKTINAWVEQKTHDRIKDLIPQELITELTRMVLTNAIYFKGDWLTAFDSTLTSNQPFHAQDGRQSQVKMMYTKMGQDQCRYNQTAEAQLLELPYQGDDLSMVLVLPFPGKMAEVEKSLDAAHWNQWIGGLTSAEVDVHLPRFKLEQKCKLNETLADMGMPTAFDPFKAEFPHIFQTGEPLYISAVIHQAFVEVKETGTEAAAATAVIIATWDSIDGTYQPTLTFRADRPFLFAICHKPSGSILFLGKVESLEGQL